MTPIFERRGCLGVRDRGKADGGQADDGRGRAGEPDSGSKFHTLNSSQNDAPRREVEI